MVSDYYKILVDNTFYGSLEKYLEVEDSLQSNFLCMDCYLREMLDD